jgi:hypothetical protein
VPPHRFVEIAGIVRAQMPLWELWHVVYCWIFYEFRRLGQIQAIMKRAAGKSKIFN